MAHSLKGQSIMVGRVWTPEHEAAGHTTSVLRADMQLAVSFSFSLGPQPVTWCRPHSEWVFPLQVNLSGNALSHTCLEVCFQTQL